MDSWNINAPRIQFKHIESTEGGQLEMDFLWLKEDHTRFSGAPEKE